MRKYSLDYHRISQGDQLQKLIESDDYEKIKEAEKLLQQIEGKYKENKQKRWIVAFIGLILGAVIGYFVTVGIFAATDSKYERENFDKILRSYFADYTVENALTEEVLIVSYSYNAREPRFYSKYEAKTKPEIFNVTMDVAAAAASATPLYFDPYIYVNGKGQREMLVDGQIIANNPSLYAFIYAAEKHEVKRDKIRVISIGTGVNKMPKINPKKVSAFTWLWNLSDLLVNVEVTANSHFTEFLIGSENYRRYQIITDLDSDSTDEDSIKELKDLGKQLVKQNKDSIEEVIRTIMDEKYASN